MEQGLLGAFDGVKAVGLARGVKAERGSGLACGPDVGQALAGVLLHLQALVEAGGAGHGLAATEAAPVVADHRLDGREQLGRAHDAHRDARAVEHRADDLGVAVLGHDDAVHDRVPADDAAGGHLEAQHRVARAGELVDHLQGGRATVEHAGVALLQDDHARALDARVVADNGGGDKVGEVHVGDEAAALVDLEHRLLAVLPLGHAHLAAQHAGVDADKGQGLGQGEGPAPGRVVGSGAGQAHVALALLGRALFVDGREREVVGQAAGGGPGVDPGQLEGGEREGEILGAVDVAALAGVHVQSSQAGGVEHVQQGLLALVPLVGVAHAVGHHAGHMATGHAARGLDHHLQFIAVGIAPHDLADIISGQGRELCHA